MPSFEVDQRFFNKLTEAVEQDSQASHEEDQEPLSEVVEIFKDLAGINNQDRVAQEYLDMLTEEALEKDPKHLASALKRISGLLLMISKKAKEYVEAQRSRQENPTSTRQRQLMEPEELYWHFIWLSREGVTVLKESVLPVEGQSSELKVMAYRLCASFYCNYVLYKPPVPASEGQGLLSADHASKIRKERGGRNENTRSPRPVQPPPGFGPRSIPAFLLPRRKETPLSREEILLEAVSYFQEAVSLAGKRLPTSHPLRIWVEAEYAEFANECVRNADGRKLVEDTIELVEKTIAELATAHKERAGEMPADARKLYDAVKLLRALSTSTSSTSNRGGSATPALQQQRQQQHQRQQQQQKQLQQRQQRVPSSVPRTTTAPPPIPATTNRPQPPFEGMEFI